MSTSNGPPVFQWSHLWKPAIVNPVNLKSYTIPFFNLRDPYARSFHLSWRKLSPSSSRFSQLRGEVIKVVDGSLKRWD